MNEPVTFSCTVVHPGLFPVFILDPFHPPRVKVEAEVGAETLSFLSSPSGGESKTLGSERLGMIDNVTIQHLSRKARRLEILKRSLARMAALAMIGFLFFLLFRPYGIGISILAGLVVAGVVGPLNFLTNGGFTVRNDVIRFYFHPSEDGKSFYLEIEPELEPEVHGALLSAGLRLEEDEASHYIRQCEDCGAAVDALAGECPHCGAELEE